MNFQVQHLRLPRISNLCAGSGLVRTSCVDSRPKASTQFVLIPAISLLSLVTPKSYTPSVTNQMCPQSVTSVLQRKTVMMFSFITGQRPIFSPAAAPITEKKNEQKHTGAPSEPCRSALPDRRHQATHPAPSGRAVCPGEGEAFMSLPSLEGTPPDPVAPQAERRESGAMTVERRCCFSKIKKSTMFAQTSFAFKETISILDHLAGTYLMQSILTQHSQIYSEWFDSYSHGVGGGVRVTGVTSHHRMPLKDLNLTSLMQ